MAFRLEERELGWADSAPVRIEREAVLGARPDRVFEVLADHERWPTWFGGMRRARVDGEAAGVGARRTVWVGAVRVEERFLAWEPGRRFGFWISEMNVPGMAAMTEDWQLEPAGAESTRLRLVIAAETVALLRPLTPVARWAVRRSTAGGVDGLVAHVAEHHVPGAGDGR